VSAIVVPPGSGVTFHARGNTLRFKAIGADTKGAFSLFEREVDGRFSTPSGAALGAVNGDGARRRSSSGRTLQ